MCGISGAAWWGRAPLSESALTQACDRMRLRGPDQAGLLIGTDCGLGHRRLAILDLSERGRQPMVSGNGAYWVCHNGEVYNFRELRRELVACGHSFRSETDTEVLLEGIAEWGISELCRRVRGMFAVAIWDVHGRRLYLLRDRLGEKPLYWTRCAGRVLFASTLNALRALMSSVRIDPAGIDAFLHLGWIPDGLCAVEGVKKVLPGTYVLCDEYGDTTTAYWHLEYRPDRSVSVGEWKERIANVVTQAVAGELASDVPLGGFLSGGVDSSVVAALAARADPKFRTFAMRPNEAALDESRFSRMVAKHLATTHSEVFLEDAALTGVEALFREFGEPFADSSAIAAYQLSKAIRAHVTVALSGDGGDEVFAGYPAIRAARKAETLREWTPPWLRSGVLSLLERTLSAAAPWSLATLRAHSMRRMFGDSAREALRIRSQLPPWVAKRLIGPRLRSAERDEPHFHVFTKYWDEARDADVVGKLLYVDLKVVLPGDYLVKMDVAAMANSLEVRSPLLDQRVVELAAQIPSEILLLNGESKGLFKEFAATLVPAEAVFRRKQGFTVPLSKWLSGAHVEGYFARAAVVDEGLIANDGLRDLLCEWRHNPRLYSRLIYALWALEEWIWHLRGERRGSMVFGA